MPPSATTALLGWMAHLGLVWLLAALLPLAPAGFSFASLLTGVATGLLVLGGFALPPVLSLTRVPPLRVLGESPLAVLRRV